MKRFLTILLGVLLIAAITAPALAWEFFMSGEAEYRYRYFARQGQGDLFGGPTQVNFAGIADGANGFAGPVANRVSVQGFSATGADASISDARVWLYPEIRINPAVRLRGEYRVTGTNLRGRFPDGALSDTDNWISNQGYNGWYIMSDGGFRSQPGGQSIGVWEKFWGTAQTPWGVFAVGRRPFPFGLGWSGLHGRDADSESWLISVPYGPLTFIYEQELREVGDNFCENSFGIVTNSRFLAAGTDKNRTKNHNGLFAIVYRNGPTEFGSLARYIQYDAPQYSINAPSTHVGAAGRTSANFGDLPTLFLSGAHLNDPTVPIRGDIGFVLWATYMKYFNGRFFFNAEYDFEYADCHRRGGRPLSIWADAWEVEMGAICGPAKLSLANFYSSGNDRRGVAPFSNETFGFAIGSPVAFVQIYDRFTEFQLAFGGRQESIAEYEFLLGIYGGGNNSFDDRGYWTARDFLAYAARLDYAVAANLNVFGTFMYANRASNTATTIATFLGGGLGPRAEIIIPAGSFGFPNVPDNYLGWEGDVGVNWKLLEGLTFNGLFAYWQPGDWFKWAYVDFGSNATAVVDGIPWPVNPNRSIDPIIGFQGSVVFDF